VSGLARSTVVARAVVDELARVGVDQLCLAPGSRSTPLVLAAVRQGGFRMRVFLDERSAAFFALGLGRATGRPAAVVTTSGTAVANLLPAVVEAGQGEAPLLLLTADRPPRLRGADANQAIDQPGIFGAYVRFHADVVTEATEPAHLRHLRGVVCRAVAATKGWPPGPVHLNLPFDKPLEPGREADGEAGPGGPSDAHGDRLAMEGRPEGAPWVRVPRQRSPISDDEFAIIHGLIESAARPVFVAGPHPEASRLGPALRRLAASLNAPLLADPLSGARYGRESGVISPAHYDLFLRDDRVRALLRPDLVLRLGAAPTSTALLFWLERYAAVEQVVVDAGHRWKDHLAVASTYLRADPVQVLERLGTKHPGPPSPGAARWTGLWSRLDEAAAGALAAAPAEPLHEGQVLAALLGALPARTPLFVSNSMPVRDLDAFGGRRADPLRVFGNRGASGIDGIVSTALGVSAGARRTVVAVVGDLALLHDVNGLLATREPDARVVFVVLNNDGGGIFHFLPVREHEPAFTRYFATPHGVDPARAGALYGVAHELLDGPEALAGALKRALVSGASRILEIRTDRDANREGHDAAAAAVLNAVYAAIKAETNPLIPSMER
jgi:2-succinyl-5-enolpyruvyl-6-hydroxy-3-cyclohexene-1-carboxylate synthase